MHTTCFATEDSPRALGQHLANVRVPYRTQLALECKEDSEDDAPYIQYVSN